MTRPGLDHEARWVHSKHEPLADGVARRLRVAYFGATDWDDLRQRPQHLASELARLHHVYYIRPVPQSRWRFFAVREQRDNQQVVVVRPRVLSPGRINAIARLNDRLTLRSVRDVMGKVDVLWLSHPSHVSLVGRCGERIVVYDMMDNHVSFAPAGRKAITDALERELLQRADLVFASSEGLAGRARSLAKGKVALVANGVEFDLFVKAAAEHLQRPDDLPEEAIFSVGFYGTLGPWVNVAWLHELAASHPDWRVVLIGPRRGAHISTLCALPNVRWLGPKPYELLPAYLQHIPVWTLPFARSDLTEDVDPVKVYEYLAAGKAVVAADLPSLRNLQSLIHLATSAAEFARGVELAHAELSRANAFDLAERRRAAVSQCTWRARGRDVCKALNEVWLAHSGCAS